MNFLQSFQFHFLFQILIYEVVNYTTLRLKGFLLCHFILKQKQNYNTFTVPCETDNQQFNHLLDRSQYV